MNQVLLYLNFVKKTNIVAMATPIKSILYVQITPKTSKTYIMFNYYIKK